MPIPRFDAFFQAATGNKPYGYQCRLACGTPPPRANGDLDHPDEATIQWLASPSPEGCCSRLIDIPTGLGKTAAVILAWLWNREHLQSDPWPRRLVYCLPMRTLVEQTCSETENWLENLDLADAVGLHMLMGGENAEGWDLYPEKHAILIGTQDMLLSRALNRGYGMSRYRWPMHFGLLNNDCLWVMDEVQLMGVGVETSAQLTGLREKLKLTEKCRTWWMSATLDARQLNTVDFPEASSLNRIQLDDEDRANPEVARRERSLKPLQKAQSKLGGTSAKEVGGYSEALAAELISKHKETSEPAKDLTLVIVNRVDRAQAIYRRLMESLPPHQCLLIHSRFRGHERAVQRQRLAELERTGGIVVATQAIEAGVDLSCRILFTELAPWPSLVQRFGRANRKGEFNDAGGAHAFWIDLDQAASSVELPYELEELRVARELIQKVENASPENLSEISKGHKPDLPVRPVVRRKDIEELFDTTPDLTGSDIDVSRYIRESEDTDVLVYWGIWPDQELPPANYSKPTRPMFCRVSVGQFSSFLKQRFGKDKKHPRVFRWNPTLLKPSKNRPDTGWERVDFAIPGQTYLIDASTPGYSQEVGWTGDNKTKPLELEQLPSFAGTSAETNDSEEATFTGNWQSIHDHSAEVKMEVASLSEAFNLEERIKSALKDAARWHDAGKAHDVFQGMLRGVYEELRTSGETDRLPRDPAGELWAKSRGREGAAVRYQRRIDNESTVSARGFRHELASALLYRQNAHLAKTDLPSLAAYLIASHHGKVRVGLRSLPNETKPMDERLFARGIWEGDVVPAEEAPLLRLPDLDEPIEPTALDLGCMRLGPGSWASDAIRLLAEFGPFRLAFLESLLRAADGRVSGSIANRIPGSPATVAEPPANYGKAPELTGDQKAMAEAIAAEGLAIQDRFRPEPLYKTTGKGHYESRTVEDIQSARKQSEDAE